MDAIQFLAQLYFQKAKTHLHIFIWKTIQISKLTN